jgi:mannose-1-phosphate guanylyltransferase
VLGAGSVVEQGARVHGSVILDAVTIARDAQISGSMVGEGAAIGAGAVLDGAIIGAGAVIGAQNELRRGIRIWPGAQLLPGTVRFSTDV